MSEETIELVECEYSDVPRGDYALVPAKTQEGKDVTLSEAATRYRTWPRVTRVRLPEKVYKTPIGFYFPLEG